MKAMPLSNTQNEQVGYVIQCPACRIWHLLHVERPSSSGAQWTFNGDLERPTFSPSLLVRFYAYQRDPQICHSFIKDGRIQFLADCSHQLAGQTVDLPEVER